MQVKFNENNIAYVTFYKWDYGQELSFDSVPENSEVHFPVNGSEDAAIVRVTGNRCLVPNSTLSMNLSSFDAWLYIDNGEQGRTKKTIHFTLIQRARPDGHIYSSELDQLLSLDGKLDKHQGAENAGKTFIIDNDGNAVVDNIPSIEVDSKLSEDSSNPIANSALAKVLSGGKLVGIEIINDYESLLDFESKYWDIENDVPNYADDEFFIVFVLDDIYDESGEYGDNKCQLKKGLYFESYNKSLAVGEVSIDDFNAIVRRIEYLERSAAKYMTASPIDASTDVYISSFQSGIKQIIKNGSLRDENNNELLPLKSGDIVFKSSKILEPRLLVLSSFDGKIYSVDKYSDTPVSHYVDETETKKLIDDKLLEFESVSVNKNYRLIADITTTEDTTYVLVIKDKNDNDFCLKKAKIFIETPAANANDGIFIKLSDVYENTSISGGGLVFIAGAINTDGIRYSAFDIETSEFGSYAYASKGELITNQNSHVNGYNPNITSINKIMIRTSSAFGIIPAGTKITIWGY